MKQRVEERKKVCNEIKEKDEIAKFVKELLLDDLPQIYNHE
jgi:hypothetical protein